MWLNWDDFGNIRQRKLCYVLQNYFISLEIIHSIINHQLLPGNMRKMAFCPNDHTVPVFGILDNVHF